MVEHLQKIAAPGSRSQGARLLAALKDKGSSGKQTGTGAIPVYRGVGQANSLLPFPPLEPPSPAVPSMPSRHDGARANRDPSTTHGTRDPYELEDDGGEDDQNRNPRTNSTPIPGVTVGKRNPLCSSEAKRQANLPTLFTREHKKLQTARLVPAGMINLGNTCYLNSVIQVLLNMSNFTGDLRNAALERLAQHLPPTGLWAALRATAEKLRVAKQARPDFECFKPAVEPSELRAAMGRRSRRWLTFAQQDAHEFLVELLEGLEDEVLTAEAASLGRIRMPLSETSCPTARNLSGSLMHTWTCSKCGHCTRAKEPFSCLSLPLPAHGTVDLQDLFFEYLKDETIYKNCDRCSPSAPLPHTAQHHFWRLPRVLVVHIKRFMPLRQLQQVQGRQGTLGGDAALSVASATIIPEGETESAAQAIAVNIPGTPRRDDSAIVRGPTATIAGAPSAPQPVAAGSRDSSPPVPYVYEKLHTVVKVTAGLDLATFCDAEARAHVHLLEGVSVETLDIGAGGNGAAVAGSADAPSEAQATAAAGNGGAAVAANVPGATTGGTLDTAGGGSTCPSPSFLQPNMSTLQERTVQQPGSVMLQREQLRRSVVGGSKATTPGGVKLRAPDSDCGTSAISTGAQANGGDGAPTPYGGCAAGIVNLQGSGRRPEEQRGRSLSGSGHGFGGGAPEALPPKLDVRTEPHGAASSKPETGLVSSPHAFLRPVEKDLGLDKYQATPTAVSKGGALSSHTCNDGMGPAAPPSDNTCRKVFVRKGGGGSTIVSSDRKTPRPIGASAFFKKGAAAEVCNGFSSFPAGPQSDADPPSRPQKRACTKNLTETPSGRPAAEPSQVVVPVSAKQLEEMTEEEQLQLALQMSLVEETADHGTTSDGVGALQSSGVAGTATGAAAGSGPMQSGRREAGLELSLPTAAPTGHLSRGGAGLDTAAAHDCTSGGAADGAGHPNKGGAQPAGKVASWGGCDHDQSLMELQDESQGGYGSGLQGKAGQQCPDGGRAASSGPALSGARGGRDDGHESEYSSGQTLPACSGQSIPPLVARLDRRRQRKRRGGKFFESDGVPEVAESPAVLPPRQKRRGDGTHNGDEGRVHGGFPIAYHIDDEDDDTTALSPVSGVEKRQPVVGMGSCARSQKVCSLTGAVGEPGSAPQDEDADLEAAKRHSLATYAEEEGRRQHSSGGGAAPGKGTQTRKSEADLEWERMLSIPDSNDPVGMVPEAAGAGCSTPKRGSACEASEVTNVQPPPLPSRHRRRSAPDDSADARPCVLSGNDEDGSRGGGMDALVAAAGLHTAGHLHAGTTAPDAAVTDRRPKALQRQGSAGALTDHTVGTGCEQFKFGFTAPDAADKAGVGPFSTSGMGFGGAGSRREDPLDLTGGDEEDPDLAKAIMLSLQDAHQQTNATLDAAQNDLPDTVLDLAGRHLDCLDDSTAEREPSKPKAKVTLVPDSDYEEDAGDGKGDKADLASAEACGSRVPTNGAPATIRSELQRQRKDASKAAVSSVSLALVARYRLQGVVRHKGLTPFSGHYVADVLMSTPSGTSGQTAQVWYEHNDAVVSHVDFARVREDASKQGYLFFFVHVPKALNSLAATVAAASAKPLPPDAAGGGAQEAVV